MIVFSFRLQSTQPIYLWRWYSRRKTNRTDKKTIRGTKRANRLKLNVVGIASSHNAIYNRDGLNLDNFKAELKKSERVHRKNLETTLSP